MRSYLAAQLSRPTGEITAAPPAQAPVSEAPSWELAARAVITLLCSPPALETVTSCPEVSCSTGMFRSGFSAISVESWSGGVV